MAPINIIIYKTSTAREPFNEWLVELEQITRSIVDIRIERVQLGNFGDCKILKGSSGIWELRINYGPGYRVYLGKDGKTLVILLTGGDKKSQEKDIKKAQKYWLDYKGSK